MRLPNAEENRSEMVGARDEGKRRARLEPDVFRSGSAKHIAQSLKDSAEHSGRRKASPLRSAMSVLTFYLNRAGKNLPATRKRTLERAKIELRKAFGRE